MFQKALILNPIQSSEPCEDRSQALLNLAKSLKVEVLGKKKSSEAAREALDHEASWLSSFDLNSLDQEDKARAFWINLYNALLIHAVLALKIQSKVSEVPGFFRRVSYSVGGQRYSLDIIEHGILRGNRGHPLRFGLPQIWPWDPRRQCVIPLDPRIHFALNCGAVSCPPIRSYDSAKLDSQLTLATESFLSQNLSLKPKTKEICLSRLLLWYAGDFGKNWPERLRWMLPFIKDDEVKSRLKEAESWKRRFDDYDWSLA